MTESFKSGRSATGFDAAADFLAAEALVGEGAVGVPRGASFDASGVFCGAVGGV
jgi:hypothetical protein